MENSTLAIIMSVLATIISILSWRASLKSANEAKRSNDIKEREIINSVKPRLILGLWDFGEQHFMFKENPAHDVELEINEVVYNQGSEIDTFKLDLRNEYLVATINNVIETSDFGYHPIALVRFSDKRGNRYLSEIGFLMDDNAYRSYSVSDQVLI